ncbi:peroxin 26 [Blumeria hordei DH14]|uniref:Peroxin 26 n=1 Tax=Blumeria graminis f. sp. hordei (strain DH14) TaxID=546991 RepID=N1JDC8_BLUG1|nr:peroxin 26 [Blumeria hordei DH14]
MLSQFDTYSPLLSAVPTTKRFTPQISKVYRQASALFLTRRLPESLSTLLPILISPSDSPDPSLIFGASKVTRVKVWSLYLTILNAICELSSDEGKQVFGLSEFRTLVTKVREGFVWDEVVKHGYGGLEGAVDTDVVINLATLLLAHARTQKISQARLETYLASMTNPDFDQICVSPARTHSYSHSLRSNGGGTKTPRELVSLVKVLELYTLHVLLRNNEWEYARDFITISPILDEERRDAFLQALQSLQDEQAAIVRKEKCDELRRESVEQIAEGKRNQESEQQVKASRVGTEADNDCIKTGESEFVAEDKLSGQPMARISAASKASLPKKTSNQPSSSRPAPAKKVPPSYFARILIVLGNIRRTIENLSISLKMRPLFLMKFLTIFMGLLVLLSRRGIQDMIKRSWTKVRQTGAMAGKVTYI